MPIPIRPESQPPVRCTSLSVSTISDGDMFYDGWQGGAKRSLSRAVNTTTITPKDTKSTQQMLSSALLSQPYAGERLQRETWLERQQRLNEKRPPVALTTASSSSSSSPPEELRPPSIFVAPPSVPSLPSMQEVQSLSVSQIHPIGESTVSTSHLEEKISALERERDEERQRREKLQEDMLAKERALLDQKERDREEAWRLKEKEWKEHQQQLQQQQQEHLQQQQQQQRYQQSTTSHTTREQENYQQHQPQPQQPQQQQRPPATVTSISSGPPSQLNSVPEKSNSTAAIKSIQIKEEVNVLRDSQEEYRSIIEDERRNADQRREHDMLEVCVRLLFQLALG